MPLCFPLSFLAAVNITWHFLLHLSYKLKPNQLESLNLPQITIQQARPVPRGMDATMHPLEILYCPKCKVGMDAALSRRQACPRCGTKRRSLQGHERWSQAEELVAMPIGEKKRMQQPASVA